MKRQEAGNKGNRRARHIVRRPQLRGLDLDRQEIDTAADRLPLNHSSQTASLRQEAVGRLQRQHGNRFVTRLLTGDSPLAQRDPGPPVPNLTGKVVLTGKDDKRRAVQVKTTTEVTPVQEKAGQFNGYDIELQALVAAQRHAQKSKKVTVVVQYRGGYRVFETDTRTVANLVGSLPSQILVRTADPGREPPEDKSPAELKQPKSWPDRVKEARKKGTTKDGYDDLVKLLIEATGIRRDEVNVVRKRPAKANEPPPEAKPGMVNLAVWDLDEATGETWGVPYEASRTGPVPQPLMVLGLNTFNGNSPEALRATFVHEARHVQHGRAVARLIEEWRKSRYKRDFHTWLNKRKKGKIKDEIYWIAATKVKHPVQGGVMVSSGSVTELFAHLDGFTSSFHQRPAKDYVGGRSMSGAFVEALGELGVINSYYIVSEPNQESLYKQARKEFMSRLERYVCALKSDHRAAFKRVVDQLPTSLEARRDAGKRSQWQPFVAALQAICQKCP